MNSNLPLIFSMALFAGLLVPAYAQTADHVVINEVDINPPADDASTISEWVELYNPTDSEIDLGGWTVASTKVLKKTMTIPDGVVIKPGKFMTYSYLSLWFTDSNESVELRDGDGLLVDKTPQFSDRDNNAKSWQRIYDGHDTDDSGDWKFALSNAGRSNGKMVVEREVADIAVTVASGQPSYLFGDTAVIEGTVSEKAFVLKPYFQSANIIVDISGPSFDKTITLYPDTELNFRTSLSLQPVLGIAEGTYDVSVRYADATAQTSFTVGHKSAVRTEKTEGTIGITTDSPRYIPGEFVRILATTSSTTPFEGMRFALTDPDGSIISSGNLFPTDGKFATSVYLTTVKPSYGTYAIYAVYSGKSVSTTFEVSEDLKENVPISLGTDRNAYSPGDIVTITGRLNHVWVSTLDLTVIQTKSFSLADPAPGGGPGFKITDGVRIQGDGSFAYSFTIPNNTLRLGDYRIDVSSSLGSASSRIHVATSPDTFVESTEPLTVESDKDSYEFGQTMTVRGSVQSPYEIASYKTSPPVLVGIFADDGTPLDFGLPKDLKSSDDGSRIPGYDFTAIPDLSGRYSIQIDVSRGVFEDGSYFARARSSGHLASSTFSVANPLGPTGGAAISLDKEVYGVGETVRLLGVAPHTGQSTVSITVTRSDGSIVNSGTVVDNQRFSWSWTPSAVAEYKGTRNDAVQSIYGIYKINVIVGSQNKDLFFKVSADPENDSLSTDPIFVSTEKSLYKAGERLRVIGNVFSRSQSGDTADVPERVLLQVFDGAYPYKKISESNVYHNQGGEFSGLFELPVTIFKEGPYNVKASYANTHSYASFAVVPGFVPGIDDPVSLLLSTDKPEYHPGDTVLIGGKPDRPVYIEKFEVSIILESENKTVCGPAVCGVLTGPVTMFTPNSLGSFSHQFQIPDSASAGKYEVTADAGFGKESVQFSVTAIVPRSETVIEKESRITSNAITIPAVKKTVDGLPVSPRAVSGSLIAPSGYESGVNLRVSSESGVCIIGPGEDCLVSESTRKPGQIYEAAKIDGTTLNVRYSGPDTRLEKFSISAGPSGEFLPDADWNVEILKDDEASRFSYKVTYKSVIPGTGNQ